MVSEAMLCLKNGRELFERTQAFNIIIWLLIQMVFSICLLFTCVQWEKRNRVSKVFCSSKIKSG